MKKITVITQSKDAVSAIEALRVFGAVHVEHTQAPKGKDITVLQEDLALVNQAIEIIAEAEFTAGCVRIKPSHEMTDWKMLCRHMIDVWKRLDHLQEYSRDLALKIAQWQLWGNFDPALIHELEQHNIYIRLYQVPLKAINNFPQGTVVKKVFVKGNTAFCLVIARQKFECALKETELPKMSLSQMQHRFREDAQVMEKLKEDLKEHFCDQSKLLEVKQSLEKDLEFQEALAGMGQSDVFTYIGGFVPAGSEDALITAAKKEQWAFTITEPSEADNPPVLLRNPRWISIISPIFKFLEILPGYRELDISLLFLVFFSIFFGILIGDAGYGLVYFLLTFFIQQKALKRKQKVPGFFLFYVLSSCAIVWGLFTGTFFGQEWFLKIGYKPLIPVLNDGKNMQRFCFFLGAFHLSIGHAWRAVLKSPSLEALADVGWMCVLWASFFIADMLILGGIFPFWGKWLIITGITLVLFFTNPQKNILKTIGAGLGTLALSLMNNFTDVVSYVRLFAVGLAGVAIADAFNSMAAMVGTGNVFTLVAAGMIALVGHALGVVLGPISVLVHGVRLNVLEFSGHANVSWGGVAYKPLRK